MTREKLLEHQAKFLKKIEHERKHQSFKTRNSLTELCDELVNSILKEDLGNQQVQKWEQLTEGHKELHFIDGHYNFAFWRKYPKFKDLIDMDRLNIVHWVLFFNQHKLLDHLLSKEDASQSVGPALMNDPCEVDYVYSEKQGDLKQDQTLKIHNLGLLICVWQKSKESWEKLLTSREGAYLMKPQEVLDMALVLAAEEWKEGIHAIVPYIETAFAKVSLVRRIDFIHRMLRVGTQAMKDIVRIEKLLSFAEWMYEHCKGPEELQFNPELKKLLPSG